MEEALHLPYLQVRVGDVTAECRIRYVVHDNGFIDAYVMYNHPALPGNAFRLIRATIDAALLERSSGAAVLVVESFEGDAETPPTSASRMTSPQAYWRPTGTGWQADMHIGQSRFSDAARMRSTEPTVDWLVDRLSEFGWGTAVDISRVAVALRTVVAEPLQHSRAEIQIAVTVSGPADPVRVEVTDNAVPDRDLTESIDVDDSGTYAVDATARRVTWFEVRIAPRR
ncbi:hypothetical protein IFM12275_44040 [Nocardia sputorum]|nr:hypothetical protein IFM12275_44040 [Nocardia sputorum]